MSVLIPGLAMPTNCCQCPVNMEICKRGYKYLLEHPELYDKRADDCPLVPVPEHGRLIDAEKAYEDAISQVSLAFVSNNKEQAAMAVAIVIRNAPTIIPADHIGDAAEMVADKEGEG